MLAGLALATASAALARAPALADGIELGGEHLGLRVAPDIARPAEAGPAGLETEGTAKVGLESMLRARLPTPGPELALELGHQGVALSSEREHDLRHRMGVRGQLSDLISLPSYRIAADLAAGYRVGDPAAFDAGTLETRFTLRSEPLTGLSTRTELGWHGNRVADTGAWRHGGHARVGLQVALPGEGSLGAFERLEITGASGQVHRYQTGVQLDFGPHVFSLSQRLDVVGRRLAGPPATEAAYGWEVGPLGVAVSADYTGESETAPARGFAGLAVTFGLAGLTGPGPGALLDALR